MTIQPGTTGGIGKWWVPAQHLDTPLAEAIHASSWEPSDQHRLRTAGQRFGAGYSDNRGGTGCAGSRLINSLSSLPGLTASTGGGNRL